MRFGRLLRSPPSAACIRIEDDVALRAADDITGGMKCAGEPNGACGKSFDRPLTRRKFIQHAAAGVAMAPGAWLSRSFAAAKPQAGSAWRCRLSTSSILFKSLPIEAACARIAALGFEAVDIWSAYDKCPHLDDAATRLGPSGLKSLLAQHHLQLCAVSVYVGGYPKYAELLGGVGGGVAIQGSAGPCQPEELTAKMRAFLESLKPLIELAERHDSRLAIENHSNSLLDRPDSYKAFVDQNTSPRVGLALAPYHLQAGGASVPEVIRICGRQLLFFYAWQNQPETGQLPGVGPTDFKPWLRALAEVNYAGHVNAFMHGHIEPDDMSAALTKSRDYLRQCAKT
jgi:sugar phosphate isomerase/epimerase